MKFSLRKYGWIIVLLVAARWVSAFGSGGSSWLVLSCVIASRHKCRRKMTNDDPVSLESNRVCKEHWGSFSKDCTVCKLEAARNEMVLTFRYVSKCCEGPYLGGRMANGPLPPQIATNKDAMKVRLDHILEVADTMVDRYGNPDGKIQPWPRAGSRDDAFAGLRMDIAPADSGESCIKERIDFVPRCVCFVVQAKPLNLSSPTFDAV